MPHLHMMDFDLSPKSRYNQETRWGNSSPVLILSLLEIVERENDVHVQEAAQRLKPGWVRNACAAFEQGMDFSNFVKHNSAERTSECVKENASKVELNSSWAKITPQASIAKGQKRIRGSTIPKSKSLESLNAHQVDKDIALKELKKGCANSKCCPASGKVNQESLICSVKRKNVAKLKRSKSTSDKSLPMSKVSSSESQSSKRLSHPEAESKITTPREVTQECLPRSELRSHNDKGKQKLQRPLSRKLKPISERMGASKIPRHKYSVGWGSQNNAAVNGSDKPLNDSSTVKSSQSVHPPRGASDIVQASLLGYAQSKEVLEPTPSSHNDISTILVGAPFTSSKEEDMINSESYSSNIHIATHSNNCNSVVGGNEDQFEDCKSLHECSKDLPTSFEFKQTEATPANEVTMAVRPKERLVHLKNSGKGPNANKCAAGKTLVVGKRLVSVDIRSSVHPTDKRKKSFGGNLEDVDKSGDVQNAMNQNATTLESACLLSSTHKATEKSAVCKLSNSISNEESLEASASTSTIEPDEITVKLKDKTEYSPISLGACSLIYDSNSHSNNLERKRLKACYTSYRHFSMSQPRFTVNFNLPDFKVTQNTDASSDHLANLKRAFKKKWPRPNNEVEKTGSKKICSLNFQVRNHPLAYRDPYESEESDESEEEREEDVTYFRLIPTYIIAKIFRYLKTRDLAALKCTCMDFNLLINHFDIVGIDSKWASGNAYRNDPCMHCGKIQDPRGDVSLCRRHPKIFYKYSHIGRCYWTCCNAVDRETVGCQVGLHNNKWTTATFRPCFICKPWRSMAWYATANYKRWCDQEHL